MRLNWNQNIFLVLPYSSDNYDLREIRGMFPNHSLNLKRQLGESIKLPTMVYQQLHILVDAANDLLKSFVLSLQPDDGALQISYSILKCRNRTLKSTEGLQKRSQEVRRDLDS